MTASSNHPAHAPLDVAVATARAALEERGVPSPDALILLGTGRGTLPGRLEGAIEVALAEVPGTPGAWSRTELVAGRLGAATVWLVEDVSDEPGAGRTARAPWEAAFPVWLAAASGASLCLHTSAGSLLPVEGETQLSVGGLALAADHLNVSGVTPLLGLGTSELGPLFPDQTRLHHAGLRARALELAAAQGIPAAEAVVACTRGPALETPAERRFLARAGASVSVLGLATPLIASAHAGLCVLAVVCITDDGGPTDLVALLDEAERTAPALEDLVMALADSIAAVSTALTAARNAP